MIPGVLTFIAVFCALGQAILIPVATINRFSRREWEAAQAGLLFRIAGAYGYYLFTLSNIADAWGYFNRAYEGMPFSFTMLLQPGTSFVQQATVALFPFVRLLSDDRLTCYLLTYVPFGLMGFAGALLLYLTLRHAAPQRRGTCQIVAFFLPGIAFWTSNVGKDSLVFFGITMVMFGLMGPLSMARRCVALGAGSALTYLVRPHTLLFLLLALLFGTFAQGRVSSRRKVALVVLALGALVFLGGDIMRYVGVAPQPPTASEEDGIGNRVDTYYEATVRRMDRTATNLNIGGSAMNRASANPLRAPLYLVQFLAGPFLWQARKPIQFLSAAEAVIYQCMILYLIVNWRFFRRARIVDLKYVWVFYIVIGAALMGTAYTNIGLAVRQKCMLLPALLLLYVGTSAQRQAAKTRRAADVAACAMPPMQPGAPPQSIPPHVAPAPLSSLR